MVHDPTATIQPLNGWTAPTTEEATAAGRRLLTLVWLAERNYVDPSGGVLFYPDRDGWVLEGSTGCAILGRGTWGRRVRDRDEAIREAWRDATGRVGVPEVDEIRAKIAAWATEKPDRHHLDTRLSPASSNSRQLNSDRHQLSMLGGRRND